MLSFEANIVQRKKDSAAEGLQEVRQELQSLENDLKLKKSQMRDSEGNEIVTNVQVWFFKLTYTFHDELRSWLS